MNQETIIKLIIGVMACAMLVLCVWAEHHWPDVKPTLALIENAALMALAGLGIYHSATAPIPGSSESSVTHTIGDRSMTETTKQQGFTSVLVLVALALGMLALSGCASLTDAGHTSYKVSHAAAGCDLEVGDGKEYSGDGRTLTFDGTRCQFAVSEGPSKAFKGQAIAVKGLSILPTLGLQDILGTAPPAGQ